MRKRLLRALIFLIVATAGAVGAATAAGAFDSNAPTVTNTTDDGINWE
jgi:hypothetical protein